MLLVRARSSSPADRTTGKGSTLGVPAFSSQLWNGDVCRNRLISESEEMTWTQEKFSWGRGHGPKPPWALPLQYVSRSGEGSKYAAGKSSVEGNFPGTYVDLIVPKALLDFIEQTAVRELAERCQVIIRSGRHELDLGGNRWEQSEFLSNLHSPQLDVPFSTSRPKLRDHVGVTLVLKDEMVHL